jgi:O-antigen ligase
MAMTPFATRPSHAEPVILLLVASFFALFFGLASVFLPAWFLVSVLVMPAVLLLVLVRPEYGLVTCVALACGLLHPAIEPRVPFLGGSIAAADATLLAVVLYAAWTYAARAGKGGGLPVPGSRLLFGTASLFGIWLVISVALSLWLWDIDPALVLGEARDLMYLLMLPAAIVILRDPVRQQRFLIGMVVLGCLFSVGQILQGMFGVRVLGSSGMSALETLGFREYSTIRTNTHGLSVIIFALFLAIGAFVLGRLRTALFVAVFSLLLTGIGLSFGRTTFAAVALCGLVIVWWLNLRKLPSLAAVLLAFIAIVSVLAATFKPATFEAVVYRMTSISAELQYGYSAGFRYMEVDAMLPHIQQHPVTGIGLGADYKGSSGSSTFIELNRYMHNAYLYMAGKMGLPALALFLLTMGAIFAMGRRLAKSDAPPWVRIVGAASAAMMIRFVFSSITEPHLMSAHGVVNIAVAGALVYLAAQRVALPRRRGGW